MTPVVDILLATYNGERFLKEQLDSIFNQSYSHFQLFVSDDGSTDGTLKIIRSYQSQYPDKIFFMINEHKQGVLNNFWKLIHSSKSDYVMFADQDDVWLPDKIKLTLQKMLQQNQTIPLLVHTDLQVVNEDLKELSPSFWKFAKLDPLNGKNLSRLLVQNVVTGCTCMVNRELIRYLSKEPPEAMMHDWWMALVAASFGELFTIPETTILYRQHRQNILGVNKFTLLTALKKGYQTFFKSDQWKQEAEKKYMQADHFLKLYANRLTEKQHSLLLSFAKTEQTHWLKRKFLFFKYKLFWHGALRNLLRFPLSYPY